MLDNIDNRLQIIKGSSNFIIIRRISDDKIFKKKIDKNNKRTIDDILY